ncbi:hypothetical protein SAMN05444143_10664 [Flavobacterium succinicans]|uniref:Uncharacterized protein n=1 Tax=Flavobacterium succinicans TaxID=29536 RepID=A0A1I4W8V8_9FLAO|nr:hypothetical protein SAMN05444143_10664 [Flavobacterium succinicans]
MEGPKPINTLAFTTFVPSMALYKITTTWKILKIRIKIGLFVQIVMEKGKKVEELVKKIAWRSRLP